VHWCTRVLKACSAATSVSKKSDRPAHALRQAVPIGHRHALHQLQLSKGLSLLVGHVLVHCQLALQRADLALLGADLLQLGEHVLGHAVLHHTRGLSGDLEWQVIWNGRGFGTAGDLEFQGIPNFRGLGMEGDLEWQCELQLCGALHLHITVCVTLVSETAF